MIGLRFAHMRRLIDEVMRIFTRSSLMKSYLIFYQNIIVL